MWPGFDEIGDIREARRVHLRAPQSPAVLPAGWPLAAWGGVDSRGDRRDLLSAARRLQDSGHVEILASAATHGYLPLLGRDSAVSAQLRTGVRAYQRHFRRNPRATWLPECAYRPSYVGPDGTVRPGLED